MSNISYRQFCPVAMAAELLCNRWTLLLVRELMHHLDIPAIRVGSG